MGMNSIMVFIGAAQDVGEVFADIFYYKNFGKKDRKWNVIDLSKFIII